MKQKIFYSVLSLLIFLPSCSRQNQAISEGHECLLCALDNNISILGSLESFSVGDSTIVVSTGDEIVQYSKDGLQLSIINKKGRGQFEYIDAAIVRQYKDRIYLWCPYLMKFIVYTNDGHGIFETQYQSAVSDFLPHGDSVFVYTNGVRNKHIIDVLDLDAKVIVDSLVNASKEHEVMLMSKSSAPIAMSNDCLYFMPKDSLVVYKYSIIDKCLSRTAEIKSSTFKVKPFTQKSIDVNIMASLSYLFNNSSNVSLSVSGNEISILTIEGNAKVNPEMLLSNVNRYSCLYKYDIKSNITQKASFGEKIKNDLVSSFNGSLYYVKNEIKDSSDVYSVWLLP